MLSLAQYRRVVRAGGWYDLIVIIGFATPWTFAVIHAMPMLAAQELPGALPQFESAHLLMANLLGSILTLWAILRIRDPQLQFGRYDAVGRLLFAGMQIYAVMHGASAIILGFTAIEILFGVIQSLPVNERIAQSWSDRPINEQRGYSRIFVSCSQGTRSTC